MGKLVPIFLLHNFWFCESITTKHEFLHAVIDKLYLKFSFTKSDAWPPKNVRRQLSRTILLLYNKFLAPQVMMVRFDFFLVRSSRNKISYTASCWSTKFGLIYIQTQNSSFNYTTMKSQKPTKNLEDKV